MQRIQNEYGVNVFFTWGVIEQEGQNKLAIIAGKTYLLQLHSIHLHTQMKIQVFCYIQLRLS